jgi:hypothetical protein
MGACNQIPIFIEMHRSKVKLLTHIFQRLGPESITVARGLQSNTHTSLLLNRGTSLPSGDRPYRRTGYHRLILAAVLFASLVLRVVLAVRGGQFFWTDESRYGVSRAAAAQFAQGRIRGGFDLLFSGADHLLFKVIGVVPALLEKPFGSAPWIAAVFFGSFSVVVIYLVWRLVLRQGGSPLEALCSALLVSACSSFFYYARHIFPYDLSLCFFLWAAICGLGAGPRNSFWAGVLSGLGFLCYNGYWLAGGVVLILTVFGPRRKIRAALVDAACAGLGLVAPIALVVVIGSSLGHDLVKSYLEFSRTTSGDFGNAWRIIPEYFWASEHYLALFWVLALVFAGFAWHAGRLDSRTASWMVGAVIFCIGMIGFSDFYGRFAVYARHTRPLALFLCLIGGWFLAGLCRRGWIGKSVFGVILAGLFIESAASMAVPMRQVFPEDFKARAEPIILHDMARDPGLYQVLADGYAENDQLLAVEERPYSVLDRSPHPLEFRPYSFDGYNEELRAAFRARDISMRVVRMLPEKPEGQPQFARYQGAWAPYPGAVRLEIVLDPAQMKLGQPLVSSGRKGAGDEVFAELVNDETIRLGFDHWGTRGTYSEPIPCDFSLPHVVVISFGSLYPDSPVSSLHENLQLESLRHAVLVKFDGVTVIAARRDSYPAIPQSVALFHNFIGFSTAERDFEGRDLSVSEVPTEDLISEINHIR